jgi:ubiquinone/menaquinone biosynthesis C-methylase UbiE
VLDYDAEAERYDETRGGVARAREAARAIERLLPTRAGSLIDVACGTGLVTAEIAGVTAIGVDGAEAMVRIASRRLGVRAVRADARALPIETGSVDVVTMIWLLHLLDDPGPVLAEAARVVRKGGVIITTVNKNDAQFQAEAEWQKTAGVQTDDIDAVTAKLGLPLAGETTFEGVGQGWSPTTWRRNLSSDDDLADALAKLPDQDRARSDPIYRLVAFAV